MLLHEPPETPYDLKFSFAGIPVRVHPFFWLITLILGSRGGVEELLIFAGVLFLSILVHELGHALMIRYFGWEPWILLYGLGGLAGYQPGFGSARSSYARSGNRSSSQILISLAGPAAGLALGVATVAGLFLAQRSFYFSMSFFGPNWAWHLGNGPLLDPHSETFLWLFVANMLYINIFWSLINLLPVFPLDGGHVVRELLIVSNPSHGVQQSFVLSMITGGIVAVYALSQQQLWIALLFGMLAYQSYTATQRWGGGSPW